MFFIGGLLSDVCIALSAGFLHATSTWYVYIGCIFTNFYIRRETFESGNVSIVLPHFAELCCSYVLISQANGLCSACDTGFDAVAPSMPKPRVTPKYDEHHPNHVRLLSFAR